MTYIRARSWHVLSRVTAGGWQTRCGLRRSESARWPVADQLPLDDKSCESCLRYTARDEARLNVANDEVAG